MITICKTVSLLFIIDVYNFIMKFAKRLERIHSSEIREILNVTQNKNIISFAGGLPSPEYFPVDDLSASFEKAVHKNKNSLYQYSITEGLPELREFIAGRMKKRFGFQVSIDEIIITSGAQQALDLISRIFIEKNKPVYIEKPTFTGALRSFKLWNPLLRGIDINETGPNLDELNKQILKWGSGIFYVIPNFQNPSGVTHSLQNRELISEIANKNDILLLEDDPYGELRFEGKELPALRSFNSNTIFLGSFSKTIAPGLRLGWAIASKPVIKKMIIAKQIADLHTSVLSQAIVLEYLKAGSFDEHLNLLRNKYQEKRDVMISALSNNFPEAKYKKPLGGLFLWCRLPDDIDIKIFQKEALKKGVAVISGSAFYDGDEPSNFIRLNFSNASHENIKRGIIVLKETYEKIIHENRAKKMVNCL